MQYQKMKNDFREFCECLHIVTPEDGLIKFKPHNYQFRIVDEYQENRFCLINKYRQGGFTTINIAYALWRAMFHEERVLFYTEYDRFAIMMNQMAQKMIDYMPEEMQKWFVKKNDHQLQPLGGNIMFLGARSSYRHSFDLIFIDEAAFINHMSLKWKALYPTISAGGRCVAVSTPNPGEDREDNWFEEVYRDSLEGKNMFHIIHVNYRECPKFQNDEYVTTLKKNLGIRGFAAEMLGDFHFSPKEEKTNETIASVPDDSRSNRDSQCSTELAGELAKRISTTLDRPLERALVRTLEEWIRLGWVSPRFDCN